MIRIAKFIYVQGFGEIRVGSLFPTQAETILSIKVSLEETADLPALAGCRVTLDATTSAPARLIHFAPQHIICYELEDDPAAGI